MTLKKLEDISPFVEPLASLFFFTSWILCLCASFSVCNGFFRFTSDAAPTDLLIMTSMAAEDFYFLRVCSTVDAHELPNEAYHMIYFVQKTYLDYRILNKYQRHKNQTGVHPNINGFDVSDRRNPCQNIHHLQTKQIRKFSPFHFKLIGYTILLYHNIF